MTFSSIQVFRALAANAVVFSHLHGIEGKYGKGYVMLPEWVGRAGPAGVHFFFVISGCVMVFASQDVRWQSFIVSRLTRIYPIYWFYTSLFILAILLVPQSVGFGSPSSLSILKSYLLWPDSGAPLLTVGWSLIFEMYFYVILTLAMALAVPLRWAFPIWAGVTLLVGLCDFQQGPATSLIGSHLTLEFIAGGLVGFLILDGHMSYRRTALGAGVVFLIAGIVRYVLSATPNDTSLITVVSLGIPFSLILYAGLSFERAGLWPASGKMVLLGDTSYSTYLSHVIVLSLLGRIFLYVPFSGWIAETAFVLLCVASANLIGIASYLWLERPTLKLCRALRAAPTRQHPATP